MGPCRWSTEFDRAAKKSSWAVPEMIWVVAEGLIQKVIPAVTNQTAQVPLLPHLRRPLCPAQTLLSSLHIPASLTSPLLMESLPKWATTAKLLIAAKSAKRLIMAPTLLGDLLMDAKAIDAMKTELWCICFLYKPPLFISFLNIFVLSPRVKTGNTALFVLYFVLHN